MLITLFMKYLENKNKNVIFVFQNVLKYIKSVLKCIKNVFILIY